MNQLFLGLAELAVAIVLSALAVFLGFSLFQRLTRGLDEWEELRRGNAAIGTVLGAIVVSVAIVLRPAMSLDTSAWDAGSSLFPKALAAEAVQVAIGLVFAVVGITLAVLIFAWLTRGVDEMEELKKGNMAIAGLLAGVVLGVGLMVSQPLAHVMQAVTGLMF